MPTQARFQQMGDLARLRSMLARVVILLCTAALVMSAALNQAAIAKRLADRAQRARESNEVVRAYLLYNEAAIRDPSIESYRASRDALSRTANLLMRTQLEEPVVAADIAAVEKEEAQAEAEAHPPAPGMEALHDSLESYPHVQPNNVLRDFDLRGDEISLFQQVVSAYGVRAAWDPQLEPKKNLRLQIVKADFRTALDALTSVTDTFVFPISTNTLYFARDSEAKRSELEPMILLTVPLPQALSDKELIDVANAVRGVLNLKQFGWDSSSREVFIRDRVSKALTARSLLEALLLPRAEVEMEVQVVTYDSDVNYHWGLSPPTSVNLFSLIPFNLPSVLASATTFTQLFGLGGGATLVGAGVGSATMFGAYTKSVGTTRYDAILEAMDGQSASAHYGEKYPIAQSLYTGFSQSAASIYNPVPQIQQEDLGLEIKLTPHVNGEGTVALDVEASYKALGTIVLNTVPSVAQREFKGNVVLREGEWAILAGLDEDNYTRSRDGLEGITRIPGLNDILAENTRDKTVSKTLILIKPRVTRLPLSAAISPQYLVGPQRGFKVLL